MKLFRLIALILLFGAVNALNAYSSWISQSSDTLAQYNSVHFLSQTTGYAVGLFGKVVKTTNGGATWEDKSAAATNFLTGVYFTSPTTGYAVGLFGMIIKTLNGGNSWSNQLNLNTSDLLRVKFPTSTAGFAVGRSGAIVKTTTSGAFWTTVNSGITRDIANLHFFNATTGYVVGAGGTILKTANGGTSWTSQFNDTNKTFTDVYFLDVNNGYVSGTGGTILKTTNGGSTWLPQASGTTNDLSNIQFINSNLGFACGSSGTILKTTNGGATWQNESTGSIAPLLGLHFVDASNGWIVGWAGTILKYSNIQLAPPALTLPVNLEPQAALPANFSWSPVSGASSYRLQISQSNTFSNLIDNSVVSQTTNIVSGLSPNTTYFWRVCARDGQDSSAWSLIWQFTTGSGISTQKIFLSNGWNMVSSYVIPTNKNIDSIFSSVQASIILVKDRFGRAFAPPFCKTLKMWDSTQAYKISMRTPDSVSVTGIAITPETTPIAFNQTGWHWFPYYRTSNQLAAISLASITGKFSLVKNINGQIYQPPLVFTLQYMIAGKGYIVNITDSSASLTYPAN